MTYVCHDNYLKPSGKLGFVITQSVFKTKGGGDGFRGLRYTKPGKPEIHLSPLQVEDLSTLQPFEGATNRTAIFVAGKSETAVKFPVAYTLWNRKKRASIEQDTSLKEVLSNVDRRKLLARPVEKNDLRSPWISASAPVLTVLMLLRGHGAYSSRKGVYCPTNGIYWLNAHRQFVSHGHRVVLSWQAGSARRFANCARILHHFIQAGKWVAAAPPAAKAAKGLT